MATALPLFNKVDLQAVMKAGRWSSERTSARKLTVYERQGQWWQQEWLLFQPVRLVVFYFTFMLLASSGESC